MEIRIDPNLVVLGPLVLTWHGLFSAVGLGAGIWIAVRLLRGSPVSEDEVMTTAFWGTVGALIGARLLHVLDQWEYYRQQPWQILLINEGGIAIFGAIIGGVLGGFVYVRLRRLPMGLLADAAAVGLILGQAIGRIGDVINGEHHGQRVPEGTPWAVVYTHPNTLGERGVPNHLAVGYELVWDLLVYGVLLGLWGRLPRSGMLFWLYLLLYSGGRFVISFFRQDTLTPLGLTQAQVVALGCAAVAVWCLVYLFTRAAREPLPAPLQPPAERALGPTPPPSPREPAAR
ncbi:MAG TPA: prolipoprotein diacylglyceryl transferase [Chloroflexota bacterium]|nr:prolipoprotein diacylglyceryl transferase [Chloroflexota bacterium]